ncbi:MAG: ABC transporter permease [Candidatus Tectomicrobia bacterium]|uniref:ABC transporter permease n=1 Tax=Tectimicrobiota bacterium TaxID=2528274 RepID=A0A937VZU2_UNCTE|nr:ABC transporter permease [Candidatus Tectomicrobia bacterium]
MLGKTNLWLSHLASISRLFVLTLYWAFIAPWRERHAGFDRRTVWRLMDETGVQSAPIVILIGTLVGSILVLQTAYQLQSYGQVRLVAGFVAVAVTRELGPLLTAILLTGRVGAAFTAELGTMKVSEEILALEVMAIHPVGFLVAPRFLALLVMLPCLTMIADVAGLLGGFITGTTLYQISPGSYIDTTFRWLLFRDVLSGLIKSVIFAVIITMVGCYRALIVEGGPEGVGHATMGAVVTAIVLIIVADGIFTAILL